MCVNHSLPESLRGGIYPHFSMKPPDLDAPVGCSGLLLRPSQQMVGQTGECVSLLRNRGEALSNQPGRGPDHRTWTQNMRDLQPQPQAAADWSHPAPHACGGDDTSHWQIMMHQNGHRYRLVQADPQHVEQAGEWCRSSDIISLVIGHQVLQRRSQRGFLYHSAKARKHQEHLDSDPQRCQTGAELTEQSSFKGLHACNSFKRPLEGRQEQQLWFWCLNDR